MGEAWRFNEKHTALQHRQLIKHDSIPFIPIFPNSSIVYLFCSSCIYDCIVFEFEFEFCTFAFISPFRAEKGINGRCAVFSILLYGEQSGRDCISSIM